MVIVEVCAGSVADCVAASKGGADRVELNSCLAVGGLTSSIAVLETVKKLTGIQVICMVRPRPAGFSYSDTDAEVMLKDAETLLKHGADGIAFGFLNSDSTINRHNTIQMTSLIHSYQKAAVFHRAFDICPDPYEGLSTLIDLGVDRVLTSGQRAKAEEGTELLQQLQYRYGNQIELLAGSGINSLNAGRIVCGSGVRQIHSSCKSYCTDPTTSGNRVSFSCFGSPHEMDYDGVSESKVRELVASVATL